MNRYRHDRNNLTAMASPEVISGLWRRGAGSPGHPLFVGALAGLGLLISAVPPRAFAQTADATSAANADADAAASGNGLQEVVVTAQHVKENAQNTPIAMSVFGDAAVKLNAITDIAGLAAVAPDLGFANVQGAPVITIRGISSRDVTENGDPAIVVNTDGFYLNRPYSLDASMYDLDRVEVLRGPQGTLNGRNSVGGAINVITAQPTHDFGAYTSVEYGNYNDLTLQGMVNIPASEVFQFRAAFLSSSHDGYRNNAPQPDGDAEDNKSARLEMAFEPFTDFRGVITAQFTREQGAGDVSENIPFIYSASGALDHNLPPGINSSTFHVGTPPSLDLTEKTVRFNLVYELPGVELTALGGYDQLDFHHATDSSNPYSNPATYEFAQNEYPNTINAELRATSTGSGPFQWQVGGFAFREHSHLVSADETPLTDGTYSPYFGFVYSTRDRSNAGYGQASYRFTDALKLTAGVRYTSDFKSEEGYYGDLANNIVFQNQTGSASSTKTIYHVALDYQVTSANLLYAKVDTGYKAGGFNFGATSYAPETVTSYELGSKNRFLDENVQLNLAAFYENYKNEQVGTFAYLSNGSPVQLTENAGASRLYGVESDFIANIPILGAFNATLNYLHARYTDFLSVADPSDPAASGNVQLAGNTPPQAPAWTAGLGLEHKWLIPGGNLTGRIQSKLQSSSNFSFYNFPDTRQGGYTLSDAFLTYQPKAGAWKITAFVKNLENSLVFANAQENQYASSYAYQFFAPRTYGARLEVSW
jgi:iron complex outermembrane recepter protein